MSSYFTESQKIRNPGAKGDLGPDPVPPPLNPYPGLAPVAPMPYGYPPYALPPPFYPQPPYAYPPYAPGYPQPPFQLMDPCSHASVRPHTPGAHGPGSVPTSPIKILLPYPVSLDEFCECYRIDDEDKGRLAKLKFQPGDRRVEKLERKDWQGHAGFSKLSWNDFLSKHKTFVCDIKAGCWNKPPV